MFIPCCSNIDEIEQKLFQTVTAFFENASIPHSFSRLIPFVVRCFRNRISIQKGSLKNEILLSDKVSSLIQTGFSPEPAKFFTGPSILTEFAARL